MKLTSGFLNTNNHPEMRKGEVFLCNGSEGDFYKVGWKTKRMGEHAYTNRGERIPLKWDIYPVFIKESEMQKKEECEECHI